MLSAASMLYLNMSSPEISERIISGESIQVIITFPQWPFGRSHSFQHYNIAGTQTPEMTLQIIKELSFWEKRPDFILNVCTCIGILIISGLVCEAVLRKRVSCLPK